MIVNTPYQSEDATVLDKIRQALLKAIAGKWVVILNAEISVVDRAENETAMTIDGVDGLLIDYLRLNANGKKFVIQQADFKSKDES